MDLYDCRCRSIDPNTGQQIWCPEHHPQEVAALVRRLSDIKLGAFGIKTLANHHECNIRFQLAVKEEFGHYIAVEDLGIAAKYLWDLGARA